MSQTSQTLEFHLDYLSSPTCALQIMLSDIHASVQEQSLFFFLNFTLADRLYKAKSLK